MPKAWSSTLGKLMPHCDRKARNKPVCAGRLNSRGPCLSVNFCDTHLPAHHSDRHCPCPITPALPFLNSLPCSSPLPLSMYSQLPFSNTALLALWAQTFIICLFSLPYLQLFAFASFQIWQSQRGTDVPFLPVLSWVWTEYPVPVPACRPCLSGNE